MCSSSGGQKLCYTVSGIITLKQVNCLKLLKYFSNFCPPDDEHMCSKHVEAWNKLIIIFSASSWFILRNKKHYFCCVILPFQINHQFRRKSIARLSCQCAQYKYRMAMLFREIISKFSHNLRACSTQDMHYATEAHGEVQRKANTYWHCAILARVTLCFVCLKVILCTAQRQGG